MPLAVNHTNVTLDSTEYEGKVSYACVVGYNHTSGDLNRTCQADGKWSGDVPVCQSQYNY